MTRDLRSFSRNAALAMAAALASGPAMAQAQWVNPPVPKEHVASIDQQGGVYDGPVAAYVAKVGERVATAAGRPGQCGFHVVNIAVVNAFTSPPGCHVYITRGLLSILNSEAELAGTLGHEIGHINANHAGRRQQRTLLTGLGVVVLGAVTKSQQVAQIASQAAQLNVLSYSRTQEYEADALGVQYLPKAGYSSTGLTETLKALQRQDQLESQLRGQRGQGVPGWLRTHPLTTDRINRTVQITSNPSLAQIPTLGRADPYLGAISGMTYGDDAAQGFVSGRKFSHPGLGVGFEAPEGFILNNGASAVTIAGPNNARAQFAIGRLGGASLSDYAGNLLRQAAGQTPVQVGAAQATRINGIEAVFLPASARTQSGDVEVAVVVYANGPDQVFQFLAQAPAGGARAFDPLFGSFHRLSASEIAGLKPLRVEVATVRAGDTAASLSERMALDANRLAYFQMINALEPGAALTPGRKVKLVAQSK
jgi:predicted Zn-dependent protease